MTTLARKRVWSAADFARHAFSDDSDAACRRARRLLKKIDDRHNGRLLMSAPTGGFTFYPSVLVRLEPDLFTPIESLEFRLDTLEEDVAETRRATKMIATQTGANTRDISKLKSRR